MERKKDMPVTELVLLLIVTFFIGLAVGMMGKHHITLIIVAAVVVVLIGVVVTATGGHTTFSIPI